MKRKNYLRIKPIPMDILVVLTLQQNTIEIITKQV